MRKFIVKLILIQVVLGFITLQIHAKPIPQSTAEKVALTYYNYNTRTPVQNAYVKSASDIRTEDNGVIDYYVFDIYPKGFVIVAADDNIEPVIGFSDESYFKEIKNSGVKDWLDKKSKQINYIISKGIQATSGITSQWQAYLNGQNTIGSRSVVNPLLSTTWNQYPEYNEYCPGGSVTGCVATAMSQIMKYWNYPVRGTGSYSYSDPPYGTLSANFDTAYQWNLMSLNITGSTPQDSIDPAAFLCYQAGISVAMSYSPSGSGAYVLESDVPGGYPCAQLAYISNFKYNPNIQGIYEANFSASQWDSIFDVELNNSRPVQYAGYGSDGGHTWVLDGCNSTGLYHMNWGWGGEDNGFFDLDNLNPGGVPLGSNDEALIYIIPDIALPPCTDRPSAGVISATSDTVCSGEGAILNLTSYTTTGIGIHITWQESVNGINNWTSPDDGTDSSNTFVTPALTSSAYFRSIVGCRASRLSDTSAPVKITVPGVVSTTLSADTFCTPQNITITANSVGASVNWYSSNSGTPSIATGNTLHAYVSSDTTFYVNTGVSTRYNTGIADSGGGGWFNYTFDDGLLFNALSNFTLDSVYVYAYSTGTVTAYLINTNSDIAVDSVTVIIPADKVGAKMVIRTNFACEAGTGYNLTATGTTVDALYRTAGGANFPYTVDNVLSITSANNGAAGYYYFFYDWHISSGCVSPLVPVHVTYSGPQLSATASANSICSGSGDSVLLAVSGNAGSYQWTPGNLAGASVYVRPTATTTYTVTGTNTNGCSGTSSVTVDVTQCTSGINTVNSSGNSYITVYPDPTTGLFELTMNSLPENSYTISIYDMLGHKLSEKQTAINSSQYILPLDISSLPPGMYFVRVDNAATEWSQPIVKR